MISVVGTKKTKEMSEVLVLTMGAGLIKKETGNCLKIVTYTFFNVSMMMQNASACEAVLILWSYYTRKVLNATGCDDDVCVFKMLSNGIVDCSQ